ncbi:hypothetical protein Hanom_Chr05g00452901 [Helianthus anomalus]
MIYISNLLSFRFSAPATISPSLASPVRSLPRLFNTVRNMWSRPRMTRRLLKAFDSEFVKVDQATLFDLILAKIWLILGYVLFVNFFELFELVLCALFCSFRDII